MDDAERDELVQAALNVQCNAYAPYSKFLVGAAIRTASGKIYTGTNVENASFGLTNCAERTAAFAAAAEGERRFTAVAVASRGGVSPCGACRQVIAEFAPDLPILLVDSENPDKVRETSLDALLPERFSGPQ